MEDVLDLQPIEWFVPQSGCGQNLVDRVEEYVSHVQLELGTQAHEFASLDEFFWLQTIGLCSVFVQINGGVSHQFVVSIVCIEYLTVLTRYPFEMILVYFCRCVFIVSNFINNLT